MVLHTLICPHLDRNLLPALSCDLSVKQLRNWKVIFYVYILYTCFLYLSLYLYFYIIVIFSKYISVCKVVKTHSLNVKRQTRLKNWSKRKLKNHLTETCILLRNSQINIEDMHLHILKHFYLFVYLFKLMLIPHPLTFCGTIKNKTKNKTTTDLSAHISHHRVLRNSYILLYYLNKSPECLLCYSYVYFQ